MIEGEGSKKGCAWIKEDKEGRTEQGGLDLEEPKYKQAFYRATVFVDLDEKDKGRHTGDLSAWTCYHLAKALVSTCCRVWNLRLRLSVMGA